MRIRPKNWQTFQHYKDRAPPWIKLHKGLLDDFDFQCLPIASKALAPMLWLLASEHENGDIDATPEKLAFRLRMTEAEVADALQPLMEKGFFISLEQPASKPLATRKQHAMPETEREAETEKKPPADGGPVWSEGLTILRDQGLSEKAARSYLGLLCRDYAEGDIVEAIKAAVGKADAKAYIGGVLKTKPKKGAPATLKVAI